MTWSSTRFRPKVSSSFSVFLSNSPTFFNFFECFGVIVGVDKIREIIENPEEGGHVTEIEVPERVEKEAYDKLKAALANNKPKKGGKGKKGKGKK